MIDLDKLEKTALTLIYPDGTIDGIMINEKLLHMAYYIELYNKSNILKEKVSKEKISFPKSMMEARTSSTFGIDLSLAKMGTIVFHNLFIYETYNDSEFIKKWPTEFYISLPDEFTDEQKIIINKICNKYDLSISIFGKLDNNTFTDISYHDFMFMLESDKIK